jgi:ferredoxin
MSLLVNWLESLSQEVQITSSCVRLKSPLATCRACADSCEQEAVSISKKKVDIDSSKCLDCGQCVIACPTSSILGSGPSRNFQDSMLVYATSSFTPKEKELLVYRAVGLRGIVIDAAEVELLPDWVDVVEKTNQRLADMNLPPLVIERRDPSQLKLSRRDWFQSVSLKGRQFAKQVAPAAWRKHEDGWELRRFYPDYQFFEVELDTAHCSLCQACFQLCPEKVFTLTDDELTIDHQRCNNCSLCIDICPSKSVHIQEKISSNTRIQQPITTQKCSGCHQPFPTFNHHTNPKCHICHDKPADWL